MKTGGTQFIASVALCWSHTEKRSHGETRFREGRVCSVRKAKVRDCHNGIIANRVVVQPAAVCGIVVIGA